MSFIGTQELLVILVVAVLVVGPKKLPDLAKNIGKGIRGFKQATAKMRSELDESGAMDEINQLKASMQGLREDMQSLTKPDLTDNAPSVAQPLAIEAQASDQVLDSLLQQQTAGPAENAETVDMVEPAVVSEELPEADKPAETGLSLSDRS